MGRLSRKASTRAGKIEEERGHSKPLDESTDDAGRPPSVPCGSVPNQVAQRAVALGSLSQAPDECENRDNI